MTLPPTEELVAEAEAGASGLFKLWLRVMRILETQDKHAKLIEAQAADITSLREAMLTLQAREDVLIARAELAAMKAATEATTDQARRIDTLRPAPAGTHKTRRFRNVGQFASRHIDCSGD